VGDENHLAFKADSFSYDKDTDTIHLKGHVEIIEKNRPNNMLERIIHAEEFIINPSSGIIKSPGAVVVEEGLNALYGEGEVSTKIQIPLN
jgi:lipopolysaccharide assembly outer membrane protein LptD (OstA)